MALGDTIALLLANNGARIAHGSYAQASGEPLKSIPTGLATVTHAWVSFEDKQDTLHTWENVIADTAIDGNIKLQSRRAGVVNPVDLTAIPGHSGAGNTITWVAIGT